MTTPIEKVLDDYRRDFVDEAIEAYIFFTYHKGGRNARFIAEGVRGVFGRIITEDAVRKRLWRGAKDHRKKN